MFKGHITTARTVYGKRTALTCLLYCALALLAPVYSAASQEAGIVDMDSLQSVALQGIYGDELTVEPGEGGIVAAPGPYTGDASASEEAIEIAVVPLPAAAWLFGSALVGFVMLSNRHSR